MYPAEGKRCGGCKNIKPFTEFSKCKSRKDGFAGFCRDCRRGRRNLEREREYARKNADRLRNTRYVREFGITLEQYNDLAAQQGHRCAICGKSPDYALAIDHDHKCCPGRAACGGCVRGLLCRPCNSGIGLLQDDPRILITASEYVAGGGFPSTL